uniref:SFRICE_020812 n=1 Tax=Spodoptera frugiperda TaxID=7108 RepID=A0A2H1VIR7_SPOFR
MTMTSSRITISAVAVEDSLCPNATRWQGKCATSTALASPPRSLLGSERRAEKRPSVARAMCSPPLPEPISGSPALSRSLLQGDYHLYPGCTTGRSSGTAPHHDYPCSKFHLDRFNRFDVEDPARPRDMNDCLGSRNEINQKILLEKEKEVEIAFPNN